MFKPPRSRVFGHTWLLAGLALTSAWAETVNFRDNFSPPSSMWNNHTGSWTSPGGDYYATVPNNAPFALTSLSFKLTSETLTVTVNSLGDSGILVRTNASDSQYVLLILGGLGYGAGFRGGAAGTAIYWADSDNPNATYHEVTGVFTPGDTYTITVTAVGDTFSAYIDGASTPVTSITDAAAGSAGGVGLYDDRPNIAEGGSGTPTTYSNFSVQGTTVPEPEGAGLLLGTVVLAVAWRRVRRVKLASASSSNTPSGLRPADFVPKTECPFLGALRIPPSWQTKAFTQHCRSGLCEQSEQALSPANPIFQSFRRRTKSRGHSTRSLVAV